MIKMVLNLTQPSQLFTLLSKVLTDGGAILAARSAANQIQWASTVQSQSSAVGSKHSYQDERIRCCQELRQTPPGQLQPGQHEEAEVAL